LLCVLRAWLLLEPLGDLNTLPQLSLTPTRKIHWIFLIEFEANAKEILMTAYREIESNNTVHENHSRS